MDFLNKRGVKRGVTGAALIVAMGLYAPGIAAIAAGLTGVPLPDQELTENEAADPIRRYRSLRCIFH